MGWHTMMHRGNSALHDMQTKSAPVKCTCVAPQGMVHVSTPQEAGRTFAVQT